MEQLEQRHFIISKTYDSRSSDWYEVVQASRIEDAASYLEHKEFNSMAPPSSVRFLASQNNEVFTIATSRGTTPFDSLTIQFEKRRFNSEFVMIVTISGYMYNAEYYIEPTTIKQIDPQ